MVTQVLDQSPRNVYVASGGQTIFPYSFLILLKTDITVIQNGNTLVVDVDFTVSDVKNINGGNVTLTVGATNNDNITIFRSQNFDREVDYQENGDFLSETINGDQNRQTLMLQQNREELTRTLQYAIDDTITGRTIPALSERIGKLLGFDSSGNVNVQTVVNGDSSEAETTAAVDNFLNRTRHELGSVAAVSSHPGISPGHIIETSYLDTARTLGSGSLVAFTGTTTPGKFGNWPDNTDGFFYDADGLQFGVIGVINAFKFGAVGGAVGDTAAVQAAISYAKNFDNPRVVVSKSVTPYIISGLALDGPFLHLDASEASFLNDTADNMFDIGAVSSFNQCTLTVDKIVNNLGSGHVFEALGLISQSTITVTSITNVATNKSIFKCLDSDGGAIYFTEFKGHIWTHSTSSTVPAIDIEGATNTCSANRFNFSRSDRTGSVAFFSLKCTGAGNFFYSNVIETDFEVVNGGGVWLYGCSNHHIQNGNFFDMGTITADLILLSSSGSGNVCRGTIIENVARNGGTLNSSIYDINLDDCVDTTIIGSGAHSSGPVATYNLNGKHAVIINPLIVTYVGQTTVQNIITPEGSVTTANPTSGDLTIAAGVITVTGSYHRVDTESAAATDDLDTINGFTDGMRLVLQSVNTARATTIKHGTGNIILFSASDFLLDFDSDTIELIYNATDVKWHEVSRSDNQGTVSLTIASGVITRTKPYHRVDTEGAASADDLVTINGGDADGQRVILQSVNAARDVTLKNGSGNMLLAGAADFVLTRVSDTIELVYNGVTDTWNEVSRSDNQT